MTDTSANDHSPQTCVGFVGLGAMGLGMAGSVIRAGYAVVAHDPSPERATLAAGRGIGVVGNPKEVTVAADELVVVVVRTADQARDVLVGDDGITAAGKATTVLVASTLDPTTMEALASEAAAARVTLIDTTMSGGPWGADAGTLTLMVSGPDPVVQAARPVLDAMGDNIFHVGEQVGTAQATKLAVQLAFGINMLSAYEAIQIVRGRGIDEDQLMEILSLSVGGSWVTSNWSRVKPWWENYVPGEDLDILLKDLRSAQREADTALTPLPMTALAFQLLRHVYEPTRGDTPPTDR